MAFDGAIFTPPPSSGWNWYNQSSGTATTIDNNAINLYVAKHGSAGTPSLSGYYRTAPSTPYTIIMNIVYNSVDINATTGLLLTSGPGFTDGTKVLFLNPRLFQTGYSLCVTPYSNSSTSGVDRFADKPATATAYPWSTEQWFMIRDDGTNIYFYISDDTQENGSSWVKVYSETRTLTLTPSSVGFFFDAVGHADINCTLNSWLSLGV